MLQYTRCMELFPIAGREFMFGDWIDGGIGDRAPCAPRDSESAARFDSVCPHDRRLREERRPAVRGEPVVQKWYEEPFDRPEEPRK